MQPTILNPIKPVSTIAGTLPEGWSESSVGGLAVNHDPIIGGMIDSAIVSGLWFVIFNHDELKTQEGFASREDAIIAFVTTLNEFLRPKICQLQGEEIYGDMAGDWAVRWHNGTKFVCDQYRNEVDARQRFATILSLSGLTN